MSRLTETFRAHHQQLRQRLDELVELVDRDPQRAPLTDLVKFLREELLPHARAEEAKLYPAVEPLLRQHGDPTATMRWDHTFLEENVRRIEETMEESKRGGFEWPHQLRREVLGLAALFRVHLEKEERVYLPLIEQHLSGAEQESLLASLHEPVESSAPAAHVLDVRHLPPPQRHPLIFGTFERLRAGEWFELVNDHDPKPLYYQFAAERAGQFRWEYVEQGPEVWRVRIGRV